MNLDLLAALRKGDITAVKKLLEGGPDIDAKGSGGITTLILASENGYTSITILRRMPWWTLYIVHIMKKDYLMVGLSRDENDALDILPGK